LPVNDRYLSKIHAFSSLFARIQAAVEVPPIDCAAQLGEG
jgi:hypothetical protein